MPLNEGNTFTGGTPLMQPQQNDLSDVFKQMFGGGSGGLGPFSLY